MSQHILITGASRGIGKALAKAYAGAGVVLGLIARDKDQLDGVTAECKKRGAMVIPACIDVRESSRLMQWITTFDEKYPVDLVVANAGVTSFPGPSGELESIESTHHVLNINIYGVVDTIYPLLHKMQRRGRGQIGIVSSLAAYHGMAVTPSYCASKAAIKCYGEALRGWLRPFNVHVSVICPGYVRSNLSDGFPGPRVFLISSDKAASLIQKGLAKKKGCIAFPTLLHFGMKLLSFLPPWLADRILTRFCYGRKHPK